jgi:hypothetical protein
VDAKDSIHVTMTGEKHLDFTVDNKAKTSPAPGNLGFNQISLHRISKKEAEVKEAKDGVPVATIHQKLSADGNELTTTTTNKGQAPVVTVWTRTGGTKAGNDLFAGEWTQDMGKSLMRQATPLRIEPDGAGGVRFTGGYSYTGKFDGKAYPVKDSLNDDVTLQVNGNAVDAIFKRDGHVTQKDHWVVNGDMMTLTSTETLETGQKMTAKVVYKKR